MDPATIAVGDTVTPFVRRGHIETWARYAAVNEEFASHHMSDEVARHEGFEGAFIMAPLTFSYVHTMLRDWVGDHGRLVSVSIRLLHPFVRGRTLTATGEVTAVERSGDELLVTCDVRADDDADHHLVTGTATVALAIA
jgi:acyl dehydratase